jgi:hypothetical protein
MSEQSENFYEENLRDEFAGMALIGLLAGDPARPEDSAPAEAFASAAYDFADAMLEARKR